MYVYDTAEYQQMRMLITDDGRAGVAIKNDEIVSLFVRPDSTHQGASRALLATAVQLGGRRLDCFDTVLPKLYAREGFVPVARLTWSNDHAPPGWDPQLYAAYNNGRPDVVFMAYDPSAIDSRYDPTAGRRVTDDDDGENTARGAARP